MSISCAQSLRVGVSLTIEVSESDNDLVDQITFWVDCLTFKRDSGVIIHRYHVKSFSREPFIT
jgi:hypothetical protein